MLAHRCKTRIANISKRLSRPQAVLSSEQALHADPRAYSALWTARVMNDIGQGLVTIMKLESMDCQNELCGKLATSAAASNIPSVVGWHVVCRGAVLII